MNVLIGWTTDRKFLVNHCKVFEAVQVGLSQIIVVEYDRNGGKRLKTFKTDKINFYKIID